MVTRKRGLGRGLDALLGNDIDSLISHEADGDLKRLPIEKLVPGAYQPRTGMRQEALHELAASIKAQGIIQPIVVRCAEENPGHYEIIAGERRWRAAQLAGLQDVPALVRTIPDRAAMCVALIENIQREELNPLEEAQAMDRLLRHFKMTHATLAKSVGRSRPAVSNLLRLLELHKTARTLLGEGSLEMGHARALLALSSKEQVRVAQQVASQGLSVRATESLVRSLGDKAKNAVSGRTKKVSVAKKVLEVRKLEESISERLGAEVRIAHKPTGKGTLTIRYHSVDELDGIIAHIR